MTTAFVSHGLCVPAFLFLAIWLSVHRRGAVFTVALVAALSTALWGAAAVVALWPQPLSTNLRSTALAAFAILDPLRMLAWIAVPALLLIGHDPPSGRSARHPGILAAALVTVPLLAVALIDAAWVLGGQSGGFGRLGFLARLGLALVGLVLTENLLRNTAPERRWSVKFLCFGIGGLFAYDFYLYATACLFGMADQGLLTARGAAHALMVPLLTVGWGRMPALHTGLVLSRRVVFHSVALLGGGLYLMIMAGAGWLLHEWGGLWGPLLQIMFLVGAVTLLVVALSSGRVRSSLKLAVARNFFRYRYDYREEWLRFIATVSSRDPGVPLAERVVKAVADIVDSPGGGVWVRGDDPDVLECMAAWNLSAEPYPMTMPADCGLARFLVRSERVVDLDAWRAGRADAPAMGDISSWPAGAGRAWLVVPLMHHDGLLGLIVLLRSRANRDLVWEDDGLLCTVGRQAASYLAEHRALQSLETARRLEDFNRRFAFVAHDVKNVVGHLSLMVSNAERHVGNPAFQADMLATVAESVERMRRLLIALRDDEATGPRPTVDIADLVSAAVRRACGHMARISLSCGDRPIMVRGDAERLTAVAHHLIDNAVEAAGSGGAVQVRLGHDGLKAVLEIEDDGPGMDAAFIRDQLFRPFNSTKRDGYGIGAYQCRELVRELGGRLDVRSTPRAGTTMRVTLPLAAPSSGEARPPPWRESA